LEDETLAIAQMRVIIELAVFAENDRTRVDVIDTLRQVGALAPAGNQESLPWEESTNQVRKGGN